MFGLSKKEKAAQLVKNLLHRPILNESTVGYDVTDKAGLFSATLSMDDEKLVVHLPYEDLASCHMFTDSGEVHFGDGDFWLVHNTSKGHQVIRYFNSRESLISIQIVFNHGKHYAFNYKVFVDQYL